MALQILGDLELKLRIDYFWSISRTLLPSVKKSVHTVLACSYHRFVAVVAHSSEFGNFIDSTDKPFKRRITNLSVHPKPFTDDETDISLQT